MSVSGWIGVDLDGTLAVYNGWVSEEHIGEPVPAMLNRVRVWLLDGVTVKIFTARVSGAEDETKVVVAAIDKWCLKHLGQTLPVTCKKDYAMVELYDDRCVQIEMNTGRRLDGKP